jgi:hypothetical protein
MVLVIAAMAATLVAEPRATAQRTHVTPDARVCHKITYTGSRLGATSICKTRREWDELQWEHDHMLREQQQLDRAWDNNG